MTVTVADATTGEGLAQATIQINDTESIITNNSGMAYFPKKHAIESTTVTVNYLGYATATLTMAQLQANNFVIKLNPVAYQLQEVDVKRVVLTVDTIMARVKKSLPVNYKSSTEPLKTTIFYRESTTFTPIQAEAEMSKSTKIEKKELDKVNADIEKFTQQLIAHPPQENVNILAVNYSSLKTVKDKPVLITKFTIEKAAKFKEDKLALTTTEVEKKGMAVLMKYLDTTKLYRIKSGIFGSRDTVIGSKPKVKTNANPNLASARSRIYSSLWQSSLSQSRTINFASAPDLYEYTLAGTVPYRNDGFVYKITFKPRKRKAKYAGVLYVSPADFAVLRAEYDLAEGKVLSGLNLKFILGIKQVEDVSRGVIVYRERQEGGGYYLHYSSSESGQYVYINRPLKFIEITDDDKEKVAFDLKAELKVIEKNEYLNVSRGKLGADDFEAVTEAEFTYDSQDAYNSADYRRYTDEMEALRRFF
ncbi:MAG: hypothetical protein ACO1N9_03630 [Flavobacterium sp.]